MKALLYEGPERVALREVPVPPIGETEALVQVDACGVCGTDLVKVFNNGHLKPPVPLGHEVAGRIHKLGKRAKGFKVGDRVIVAHHVPCRDCHYCRRGHPSMCREFKRTNLDPGGFSQFIRVSERHLKHTTLRIPPKLDFVAASQVEPLACCLRNARRLGLEKGDVAAIFGLGSIGLMTAQLLGHFGVSVVGLDLDPQRVEVARKAGVRNSFNGKDPGAEKVVRALSEGRGADALVFTAGTPQLVSQRLAWLRDGGTVNVFASFHPESSLSLDLNEVYHRELRVISSYSPALEDLRESLKLIASGKISMEPHIGHVFTMLDFGEAVRRVRSREILKAILLPQEARSCLSLAPSAAAAAGRR